MNPRIKIARNVLAELAEIVREGPPVIATDVGELFLAKNLRIGAIRLKISIVDYFNYLAHLPEAERPDVSKVVPIEGCRFQVVINGVVTMKVGTIAINGRAATIL